MTEPTPTRGVIPYPSGGILRFILRLPLVFHRLGWGWMLGWLPFVILTTRGRKSGEPRHVVLEYRRHGSKYYVISGWGTRPNWYQNLRTDPIATLQLGNRRYRVRATLVNDAAETLRVLYMFRRNSPLAEWIFTSMSSADKTDLRTLKEVAKEFTVVRFDVETGEPELNGVEADFRSFGWLLFGIMMIGFLIISFMVSRRQRDHIVQG